MKLYQTGGRGGGDVLPLSLPSLRTTQQQPNNTHNTQTQHTHTKHNTQKKARNFWPPTLRSPPFGAPPSGPPQFGASTLRGPTLSPPFGPHPSWSQNSTFKNWPESKLAEGEIARTRKKSWPKSKLAEVDRALLQDRPDTRRLEVVVDGLTLHHGVSSPS